VTGIGAEQPRPVTLGPFTLGIWLIWPLSIHQFAHLICDDFVR
jgi:hypothetical protein